MIPITTRQLQYFVAVYEEGGFSKAAQREHCSQPALSAQIRNLETVLGRTLFERSVSGVMPTAAGQRFYRHAVSILRSLNSAKLELAEVTGQISGQLRVGLIPSAVRGLLPTFLPAFVDTYTMIDVRLIQGFSDTLADAVVTGMVDFAIVLEPPKREGVEITKLAEGQMVLITGSGSNLSAGASVKLPELPPLDLVVPSPNHTLRRIIERRIWTKEINVSRILEMDTVHGMIDLVKHSNWTTILPLAAVACDIGSPDLLINPIMQPYFEAHLYLINLSKNPLSIAAQVFVEELRKAAQSVGSRTLDLCGAGLSVSGCRP